MKHLLSLRCVLLLVLLAGHWAGPAGGQEIPLVNLTTGVVGNGTVERNPDQTFYEVGTTVSLRAIADDGFVFQAWSGPVADPLSAETTILLKSNTLVGATFVSSSKPQLKTDPDGSAPLDFGTVETGLLSNARVRTITLTNVGGGTLEGTAVVGAGTSRPFGVLTGGSFSLAANQSSQVLVIFDPFNVDFNSGGVPLGDVLNITSNGGNAVISLAGVAVPSSELVCSCASVDPGGKPWGDALVLLAAFGILAMIRPGRTLALTRLT